MLSTAVRGLCSGVCLVDSHTAPRQVGGVEAVWGGRCSGGAIVCQRIVLQYALPTTSRGSVSINSVYIGYRTAQDIRTKSFTSLQFRCCDMCAHTWRCGS